ncbi:hypothetical protein GGS21DRAFT_1666 [Xylaria nigripes]|nr:hypothetical protein GGS21DRAFT_1666 [Xylaria nigripes]
MAMGFRSSGEMHAGSSSSSPSGKAGSAMADAKDNYNNNNASGTAKKAEGEEAMTRTSSPARNRLSLRKAPTSTRSSMELFRSRRRDENNDEEDAKSKQGSGQWDSGSSNYATTTTTTTTNTTTTTTTTTTEERRLSDKMKKAWRGVTGQRTGGDQLEQWMARHSGGTLRDTPSPHHAREQD